MMMRDGRTLAILVLVCAAGFSGSLAPKAIAGQSLDDLEATRSRPLFSPNRQAPPKPVIPPPPPPAPPREIPAPSLRLVGIIFSEAEKRAIVVADNPTKPRSVQLGDDIEGWTVSRIDPRRIELHLGERSVDVALGPAKPNLSSAAYGLPGFGGPHGGRPPGARPPR